MIDPDIRLFIAIVEAGSLAGAARRTHRSAPMVSRQLARLEDRLGQPLLHRTTRQLQLTAAGAIFYEDARRLLEAADAAEARIQGIASAPRGPLRISAPTSFGRLHVAPLVQPFRTEFPEVTITLDLSDTYVDLVAERYDLAVRIIDRMAAGPNAQWLGDSPRVLCAAPAYIARRGLPADLRTLQDHDLLAAEGQLPWRVASAQREIVVPGESIVRTNSSEVVRELALAGAGIAQRSLWDVGGELALGRLQRVLPQVEGSHRVGIFAVRPRSNRATAAAGAFVAHLRRQFGDSPRWDQLPSQA